MGKKVKEQSKMIQFLNKWGIVFVFLGAILPYLPTLLFDYTLDDSITISENVFTKQGIKGIPDLFKYDTFHGFFQDENKLKLVSGGRYRPLTPALFAVEYQLFGLNSFWGHLFNIIWYGLCCSTIFLFLRRLLTDRFSADIIILISVGASLLFALHPVHSEAVANIKGRDEILALFFSVLSGYSLLRWYDKQNIRWLGLSGLFLFAGLLSKENAITWFAIFPLMIYFFRKWDWKKVLIGLSPALIAIVGFLALRFSVLGHSLNLDVPGEMLNNPFIKVEDGQYVFFNLMEKSASITYALGKYLALMIFPHPLTHDYYPRHIPVVSWNNIVVIGSFLVYSCLTILSLFKLKKKSIYVFSWLYFLVTISIVSNVFFPVGTHMSERFLFMPSLGFCLIIPTLLFDYFRGKRINTAWIILGLLVVGYVVKTQFRLPAWKNNYSLFSTDAMVSVNSAKVNNAFGGELSSIAGRSKDIEERKRLSSQAIPHLDKAIEIHPHYKNAWLIRGNAYLYLEDYQSSISSYENALRIDPSYMLANDNLAVAYRLAGKNAGEKENDLVTAIDLLKKAYTLRNDDYETLRLLGVAYSFSGDMVNTEKYFREATEKFPKLASAWYHLGTLYYQSGDDIKGKEYLDKAIELDPDVLKKNK